MNRMTLGLSSLLLLALVGIGAIGCEEKPSPSLAPTASALVPTKPAPATAESRKFAVDKDSSKVEFMMEATQEKIRGRANGTMEGELQVDLKDLTQTTGLLTVDISAIELLQAKADDAGKFGAESKSDPQNEHARTWLEISPDAPEDVRKKNSRVEFAVRSIDKVSEKGLSKLTGATRRVILTVKGDFLLHGRKAAKTVELEAVFTYEGEKPVSVAVKTARPFGVGLAEHDVHPRDKFGSLAKKTLEMLAPKVAKEAMVSLDFTAKLVSP